MLDTVRDSASPEFDPARWIAGHCTASEVGTPQFIYDHLVSQSGHCLPILYEPFDPRLRAHFADRGDILDFACHGQGGRVLDFGPGDGWPSLLIAPDCVEVVGVDASARRVAECEANAARLGIANARFVEVVAGEALPFANGEFDAVMAASSIEQAPEPPAVLQELARVLRPGGRLRMFYEGLARYRGGHEREASVVAEGPAPSHLLYAVRDLAGERARQWRVSVALGRDTLETVFARHGLSLDYPEFTLPLLEELDPLITDSAVCTTRYPSCNTWLRLLAEAGFSSARPTHSGRALAQRMYEQLAPDRLPRTLADTDALLRAPVHAVVELAAPVELDSLITAVK